MKKYLLIFLFLIISVSAQSIKAGYDVSFGIIGEIGKAEITYIHDENSYLVFVHAWTTGMSAVLSQNREESYISQGRIINGILRPDAFVKHRKNDRSVRDSVFLFDYVSEKVYADYTKVRNVQSTSFDIDTMKNTKVETEEFSQNSEIFRFFTDNDLLSLFFNTQKILPTLKYGEAKQLVAIGSKSPNCEIDIEVPDEALRTELQAIMADTSGNLITIILHQDIFQSERGELHVNFDDDGFAKDVVLKDVIMFGDIRGKRIYQDVRTTDNVALSKE
jgi:hypothetical protein